MLIKLTPTAVIGKRSAGEDFSLLRGRVSSAVEGAARAWLQVYLNSRNPMVVAYQVVEGEPWLFRAQGAPATDAAGRPRALVTFGKIAGSQVPRGGLVVPDLLLAFGRLPLGSRVEEGNEIEIGFSPSPEASGPPDIAAAPPRSWPASAEAAEASVALAVEHCGGVAKVEDAVNVLRQFGSILQWIALIPRDCPPRLPEGIGLAISHDRGSAGEEIRQWVAQHGARKLMDLPLRELAELDDQPAVRRMLVGVACGLKPPDSLAGDASVAALQWLATTPHGRPVAVELLSPRSREDIGRWLGSRSAAVSDLEVLRHRLEAEHREAVARLLRPSGEHFELYAGLYPHDSETLRRLMPAGVRRAYEALERGDTAGFSTEDLESCIRLIGGTELLAGLSLAALAGAARRDGPLMVEAFGRSLAARGLPEELLQVLLYNRPGQLAGDCGTAPDLEPNSAWLQGIDPRRWLEAGRSLPQDVAWRDWWCRGVRTFMECGLLDRADLVRQGLRRDRWLLIAAGLPSEVVSLVHHAPDDEKRDLPVAWNERDEIVDEWLGQQVADGTLFQRLRAPLSPDALQWLEQRVKDENVRNSIREAGQNLDQRKALSPRWLGWIGWLLSRKQLLEQIAAWALQPLSRERRQALESLLRSPQLTADEGMWLRARTLDCVPLPVAPTWAISDMTALLPILDPLRDVIPDVLEREHRDAGEEELLRRVMVVLRHHGTRPGSEATILARKCRPDWVAALSSLPGWEGFAGDTESLLWDISARCRRLREVSGGRLPDEVRAAVDELAGGNG